MASQERRLPVLKTYNDVKSLSSTYLKTYCVLNQIPLNWGKKAKINLLCQKLNISTCGEGKENITKPLAENRLTGQQLDEFKLLKPSFLSGLTGWSSDLQSIPDLDERTVKDYLLEKSSIGIKESRYYRLSRPYQLKPFVHSLRIHSKPLRESSSFIIIRAECNPSQSSAAEDVKVVFAILDSINGQPLGGYCTCTVGFCQACGHIGATLFRLADLVTEGIKQIKDDVTCTEKLCEWIDPKGAAVAPKLLDEINVGSTQVGHQRRTINEYGKTLLGPLDTTKPPLDLILRLRHELMEATKKYGKCVPAVHVLTPRNFGDQPRIMPLPVTKLPEVAMEYDSRIVYSKEVTVRSKPTPIAFIKSNDENSFIDSISCTQADRNEIEHITSGQSNNIEWFNQRMGSITCTTAGDVVRLLNGAKINPQRIVNKIMGYRYRFMNAPKVPTQASLKWGIMCEEKAIKLYEEREKNSHKNLQVCKTGLVVHPDFPYLRASPDGIKSCDCHSPRLIEVKCPCSVKEKSVVDAVNAGQLKYITRNENGHMFLRKDDPSGYFHQVQLGMAVTNTLTCDFIIFTNIGINLIEIPFDETYWLQTMKPSLIDFFKMYVVPSIIMDQMNHTYSDTLEMDSESSDEEVL